MTARSRDFRTTSAFAASLPRAEYCSWSGARLHPSHVAVAVGARRLLSTPSPADAGAWLGVGSDAGSRAFAEFDGLHLRRFPRRAQIVQVPCVYQFHHSGVAFSCHSIATGLLYCHSGTSINLPQPSAHTTGQLRFIQLKPRSAALQALLAPVLELRHCQGGRT